MQLREYSLALISVVLTSHNCNKTNIWTSIADPEEIQNAKKKKKKVIACFWDISICIENLTFHPTAKVPLLTAWAYRKEWGDGDRSGYEEDLSVIREILT